MPTPPTNQRREIRKHHSCAFTLIELLVVIAIVAILSAILIPVLSSIRGKALATKCASNLRQIYTGLELYAQDNDNTYPRFYGYGSQPDQTWMQKLSPYVGIADNQLGSSPKARSAGVFVCPSHDIEKIENRNVSYALNLFMRQPGWEFKRSVIQEPPKTILIAEIDRNSETISPYDNEIVARHPNDTANFLFADGHVETLKTSSIEPSDPRWRWE